MQLLKSKKQPKSASREGLEAIDAELTLENESHGFSMVS